MKSVVWCLQVICDCDRMDEMMVGDTALAMSPRRGRSLSPSRSPRSSSQSPVRGRSVSPNFAHATYAAVQAAMHKRQLQVGELHAKLSSAREQQQSLRRQLDETTAECRRLDQSVMALSDDKDSL